MRAWLVCLAVLTAGCGETTPPAPDHDAGIAEAVAAFQEPRRAAWKRGVEQLVALGPGAVPKLLPLLEHEHRSVREWTAHALGDLAPQDRASIDALIRSLDDPDDYVCIKAARALGRIGPAAYPALPVLTKLAIANQEALSGTAALAVDRIDPHPD